MVSGMLGRSAFSVDPIRPFRSSYFQVADGDDVCGRLTFLEEMIRPSLAFRMISLDRLRRH